MSSLSDQENSFFDLEDNCNNILHNVEFGLNIDKELKEEKLEITKKNLQKSKASDVWEVIPGLQEGQKFEIIPHDFSGYLLKKRKWPLKGWHKKGILTYAKNAYDHRRGKTHGLIDIGLSVITTLTKRQRLDIDAEDCIYHLKVQSSEHFCQWLEQLKQHRLFKQNLFLNHSLKESVNNKLFDDKENLLSEISLFNISAELTSARSKLFILKNLSFKLKQYVHKRFEDRIKKKEKFRSNEKMESKSAMNMASDENSSKTMRPSSLFELENVKENKIFQEWIELADILIQQLQNMISQMDVMYKQNQISDNLKQPLINSLTGESKSVASQKMSGPLDASFQSDEFFIENMAEQKVDEKTCSLDRASSITASDFYDALEYPSSSSESLSSDAENSLESDYSDQHISSLQKLSDTKSCEKCTSESHRTKLPVPQSMDAIPNLWNLFSRNIGRDLSRIAMPVTLNEPLNMLQRICEELEYSDLLISAAQNTDPVLRLLIITAFAVSSYGSQAARSGRKPFNPILGETFEYIKDDLSFRFISEQVSHHPPISTAYADSKYFIFVETVSVKMKFWGKSLELLPQGKVQLQLLLFDGSSEIYEWNKLTTCVHNLFGGQPWVDHFGKMLLKCHSNHLSCQLTFHKGNAGQIYGVVLGPSDNLIQNVFGKWNEGLYYGASPMSSKCLWKPNSLPDDYSLYYGFTYFAIELNELNSELRKWIPCTDTRLRPDQRLLEQGYIDEAEEAKQKIEEKQRQRIAMNEQLGQEHKPRWFYKHKDAGGNQWKFGNDYWHQRNKGFSNIELQQLW